MELCGIDSEVVRCLARTYRTSLAICDMLCGLLTQPVVPSRSLGGAPTVKMRRLRAALEPFRITVHSHRGVGYWLDDNTKIRICNEARIDHIIRLRGAEMDSGDADDRCTDDQG